MTRLLPAKARSSSIDQAAPASDAWCERAKAQPKFTSQSYFIHYAQPGKHRYWTKNLAKDSLNLEVEDGETYFVKCEIAIGLMSSNPNLLPSDVTEFERSKDKLSPMAD